MVLFISKEREKKKKRKAGEEEGGGILHHHTKKPDCVTAVQGVKPFIGHSRDL